MKTGSIDFKKLPFTKLFQDYTSGISDILQFYETNPFDEESIKERIDNFSFSGNRESSVEALKKYNKQFNAPDAVFRSIDKLNDNRSLAIVTGQQLTLFGGPVFTIYKTITAINFARQVENKFGIPVVPVFWMADEDHDFDEVSSIHIPGGKETMSYKFRANGQKEKPSGFIKFNDEIEDLWSDISTELLETDFSKELSALIEKNYKSGSDFGTAFGNMMLHLFSDHGLILSGSNFAPVKKLSYHPMQTSVMNASALYDTLTNTSTKLESAGYHRQVYLNQSNLFWLDDDNNRVKIQYEKDYWYTGNENQSWTTESLILEIEHTPERFSPNVFLRPIMQDHFIPTLSYIAGPGEVAYYAQMKNFYQKFDKRMPIIKPRISATIIESGIDRILKKLPFHIEDYSKRIEDLESEYVASADTPDIEKIFNDWKQKTGEILEQKKDPINEIDPTLTNSAEKAHAVFTSELDKLKGKVYRSVKKQENVQINRIKKIQNNLFPNGNLQEREVAFIYFMNKYGMDIWDILLEELKHEHSRDHKYICL